MSTITKVALAGANGTLGAPILAQLLESGFQVTVLTRQGSSHQLPDTVTVKAVDYDSEASLTSALKGQHAVVAAFGHAGLSKQTNLIRAAVRAGVSRFIPSEFGSDLGSPKTAELPVFAPKVAVQKALDDAAASAAGTGFTWTAIRNGVFFDWGLRVGLILDAAGRSITLYNGGERPFSTTRLSTVAAAVVGVLKHPRETANRAVYVHDAAVTGKQLRAIAEKVTGKTWQAKDLSIETDVLAPAWAKFKTEKPDADQQVFPFILAAIYGGDEYGSHFRKTDNALLGLKELNEAEVETVVAQALK